MKDLVWGCTLVICGTLALMTGLLCFTLLLFLVAVGGYDGVTALAMFMLALVPAIVGALLIMKGKNAVNTAVLIEKTRNKD